MLAARALGLANVTTLDSLVGCSVPMTASLLTEGTVNPAIRYCAVGQ